MKMLCYLLFASTGVIDEFVRQTSSLIIVESGSRISQAVKEFTMDAIWFKSTLTIYWLIQGSNITSASNWWRSSLRIVTKSTASAPYFCADITLKIPTHMRILLSISPSLLYLALWLVSYLILKKPVISFGTSINYLQYNALAFFTINIEISCGLFCYHL